MVDPIIFYIVNLIAYFNLLVNNKLITQFIIAFTFVNMSKIAVAFGKKCAIVYTAPLNKRATSASALPKN